MTGGGRNRNGGKKDSPAAESRQIGENGGKSQSVPVTQSGETQADHSAVTLESIQNSIIQLHNKFDNLSTAQNACEDKVNQSQGQIDQLRRDYGVLSEENKSLREDVNFLKSIVQKQTREITLLKQDVTNQKVRSMGYNALFHNLAEEKDENCEAKVKSLLQKIGYTDPYTVERAHRIGAFIEKARSPRPVVVRMSKQSEAEALIRYAAKNKNKLKVTSQFPPEVRERRRQLGEIR